MQRLLAIVGALAIAAALLLVAARVAAPELVDGALGRVARGSSPETVIESTLVALRQEQTLVVLSAGVLGVVTSRQDRAFGRAEKTMLVPGTVRYALDLARLAPADLRWDPERQLLSVRRPPLLFLGPEIDPARIREYGEIGFIPGLLGAEAELDSANRGAAREALLARARSETLERLAREAGDAALRRSFEVPLHAAGLPRARVEVVDRS